MPNLIETSACEGLLPVSEGGLTLSERTHARITSVAPFKGKTRATSTALKALGLGWPAPGKMIASGDASILWTGVEQAFLIGADPGSLAGHAALTDQSDGWARIRLTGAGGEAVLARLVPVDLRPDAFPPGSALRTGLNHMSMILARGSGEMFEIMVFRSMAASAVHELHAAMKAVAARAALR